MASCRIQGARTLVCSLAGLALLASGLGAAVVLLRSGAQASSVHSTPLRAPRARGACLAVVIDDVGRDLAQLRALLALDLDLTFAVLPHARHTDESLRLIRARRREYLLHLPLAPLDQRRITDEPVVLGRDGTIETGLEACIARVPGAVGANNHMGSALSLDDRAVSAVLRGLGERGMFFLDSRTTGGSRFCAHAASVPCLERDLFLDDPPDLEQVRRRLAQGVELARARGRAIVIGHPGAASLQALLTLKRGSVRLCRLSELIRDQT